MHWPNTFICMRIHAQCVLYLRKYDTHLTLSTKYEAALMLFTRIVIMCAQCAIIFVCCCCGCMYVYAFAYVLNVLQLWQHDVQGVQSSSASNTAPPTVGLPRITQKSNESAESNCKLNTYAYAYNTKKVHIFVFVFSCFRISFVALLYEPIDNG